MENNKGNTITDLVDVLASKAKDGIKILNDTKIEDEKFKTVLENTLTCVSVVQKMTYDAQQARGSQSKNTKPNIKV